MKHTKWWSDRPPRNRRMRILGVARRGQDPSCRKWRAQAHVTRKASALGSPRKRFQSQTCRRIISLICFTAHDWLESCELLGNGLVDFIIDIELNKLLPIVLYQLHTRPILTQLDVYLLSKHCNEFMWNLHWKYWWKLWPSLVTVKLRSYSSAKSSPS